MYGESFNVAHIEHNCSIYGPGTRTVVWLQGCSIHCKGCWNTEMWSFEPNVIIRREKLLSLLTADCICDGVTILGGEPLDQSDNLLWLFKKLKENSVNIMLYTGHEPEEIQNNSVWKEICELADILIPSRYKEEYRNTNLLWRGSENQSIISKENIRGKEKHEVEIHIDGDGRVICMGYPDKDLLDMIFDESNDVH